MQLAVYTTIITVTAMADAERVEEEEGLPVSAVVRERTCSIVISIACEEGDYINRNILALRDYIDV